MPGEKAADKSAYETFDSGGGPTVPEDARGDFAHNDADPSDHDQDNLAVPELPQKK